MPRCIQKASEYGILCKNVMGRIFVWESTTVKQYCSFILRISTGKAVPQECSAVQPHAEYNAKLSFGGKKVSFPKSKTNSIPSTLLKPIPVGS